MRIILILAVLFLFSCGESKDTSPASTPTKNLKPRMAAEWEPALGTIIAWPLGIPHKLVIELAKDNKLFTMVSDESAKKEAEEWFTNWGIDLNNVQFIFAEQSVDAWWLRDWGPHAVFTDGKMKLADGQYPNSTPLFLKLLVMLNWGLFLQKGMKKQELKL